MILYAEPSAVLAWLLGETDGAKVRELLASAAMIFASRLTTAEAERGLARLETGASLPSAEAAVLRETLSHAASHWIRRDIDAAVLARVGRSFPVEPVRTLDAIHLATVLELRASEPRLAILSLDHRIRGNAERLGIGVVP